MRAALLGGLSGADDGGWEPAAVRSCFARHWFIACDFQEHYLTLFEPPRDPAELARIALFDFVANYTDSKSGHVLRGDDRRIWGIDHGLCFSAAFNSAP